MSQYVTISIFDADLSKLSFGPDPRPKRRGEYSLLYDSMVPTFTFNDGMSGKNKYMCSSYNGVVADKVWNASTYSFTEDWAGTYSINFRLAEKYSELDAKQRKIKDFMDAAMNKVNTCQDLIDIYGTVKCELMYQPTFIKREMQGKMRKTVNINEEKGIYFTIKCSYSAPPDAPTFKNKQGKDEPELEYRFLSTPFYHPKKGQAAPSDIMNKGLKCLPEMYIGYSCINSKHYLTMRMNKCYYVNAPVRTQGPDPTVLSMMSDLSMDDDEEEN